MIDASSVREVKLSEAAVDILKRIEHRPYLRDDTPEEFRDLVFLCKRNGLPVRSNTYDNALRKRQDIMYDEMDEERVKNNLKPVKRKYLSAHDLRHTYASLYLESAKENGRNFAQVFKFLSKQLWHKSTRTTIDIYCHLYEESEKDMIEDLRQSTGEGIVMAKLNGKQVGAVAGKMLATKKQ